MPTRFYLTSNTITPGVTVPVTGGTWNGTVTMSSLPDAPTGSALNSQTRTFSNTVPYLNRRVVTAPLPYAMTLSGTVRLRLRAFKTSSNATYDAFTAMVVRVVSGDGATDRGVALPYSTHQLTIGTSNVIDATWNLTNVAVQAGDRIYVEVGAAFTGTPQGQGSTHYWGDPLADPDIPSGGRPWLEFSTDLMTPPLAAPGVPTGLTQTGAIPTTVTAAWTAPVGGSAPTSYEYSVDGGAAVSVGLVLSATIGGFTSGQTKAVRVRAVNGAGASAWSAPVNFTSETVVPPTPTPTPTPTPSEGPQCFAPVRGSAIRVTGLTSKGRVPDLVEYVTSKSVIKVAVTEVIEQGSTAIEKNPEEKRRLRINTPAQIIRHKVDIEFLRVDPEMLRLVAGVGLVYKYMPGFGEVPFGLAPFGGGGDEATVVGFDSGTTLRATSFALEVWSKLDSASAKPRALGFDEVPFDTTAFDTPAAAPCTNGVRWGYTLFPFLRGGRLSGFTFADGLVSFNLIGAQTRRNSGWGVGPYDLSGEFERLSVPVSRNTSWRMFITPAAPPVEECGIQYLASDVLDNGTAGNPMPDPDAVFSVDGGGAETSAWIIDGGRA